VLGAGARVLGPVTGRARRHRRECRRADRHPGGPSRWGCRREWSPPAIDPQRLWSPRIICRTYLVIASGF
jgi:hypothetical protein